MKSRDSGTGRVGVRRAALRNVAAAGVCVGSALLIAWIAQTSWSSRTPVAGGGRSDVAVVATAAASATDVVGSSRRESEAVIATREETQSAGVKEKAAQQLGALPIVFAANHGQWPDAIRFGAPGSRSAAALTDRGVVVSARLSDRGEDAAWHAVALQFVGPERSLEPRGERRLPGVHHYLLGNDPSRWHADVPLFEEVRYDEVAPGVAVVVSDREGRLEYDLHVEAGADLAALDVTCEGAEGIVFEEDGSLSIATPAGVLRQTPPKAWYETPSGEPRPVDCTIRRTGPASFGFEVVTPDPSSRLIVDPGLCWSTFLGGTDRDEIHGVDEQNGKITVVGATYSTENSGFPSMAGRFDPTHNGIDDAFVTRFDPAQSGSAQLVWTTFLGGDGQDKAFGVSVSSNGRVAVCGSTGSTNFPVSGNGHQQTPPSASSHGFVVYLAAGGATLLYGSYWGGTDSNVTTAYAVAVDTTPILTVVGSTSSSAIPLVSAYDTSYDGGVCDACIARYDPNAGTSTASLVYSSYIGGGFTATDDDEAHALDLESGRVYIGGFTRSGGFHTINRIQLPPATAFDITHNGARDGFLMVLDPAAPPATQLLYSTFLGGSGDEEVWGLDVLNGVFYACGRTGSSAFPLSVGGAIDDNVPFQSSLLGIDDAFITRLDPSNTVSQLRYSTYLGGSLPFGADWGLSIQRVTAMCVVVVGWTQSSDFPVGAVGDPNGPFDPTYNDNGGRDAFLTRLNWAAGRVPAAQLDYSTYLGTIEDEEARSLALSGPNSFFGGFTAGTGFPTAGNPFQATYGGGFCDGFVCNLQLPLLPFP